MAYNSLTPRQHRFIAAYLISSNATQAYIDAGYSYGSRHVAQVNGQKLLSSHVIRQELANQHRAITDSARLSQEYVIRHLMENTERAMQEEPVYDKRGEPTGEYTYQGSVANKSLELLGRHLQMWGEDKPGQGGPANISFTLKLGDRVINLRNGEHEEGPAQLPQPNPQP